MGLPETKLGIIPGAGGTQRLPRLIGLAKAKDMVFTGKILGPQAALEVGLLTYLGGFETGLTVAREILSKGPIALKMAKVAMSKGFEMDL